MARLLLMTNAAPKVLPDDAEKVQTEPGLKVRRSRRFDGYNVDGNVHPMALPANQNASRRAHVVVISSPRQRDVTVARHQAIRGIKLHPARAGHENADPRMRCICAGKPFCSRWGKSHQISTDVSRRKSQRAQAADLQMGEILADALARTKNFLHRRIDFRGARQKFELLVNALGQVQDALASERLLRFGTVQGQVSQPHCSDNCGDSPHEDSKARNVNQAQRPSDIHVLQLRQGFQLECRRGRR